MTQYTQKAFKLDKEYPMTCALFGGYFLLRKSYPTVDTLARKAIEHTDVMQIASDGWYLLGRKAHYEGDLARAAEYYSRSDQARGGGDKGYLPAKFGAVQMQVSGKDLDGAKFRLEKIIQQTKNPECMILLGALLAEEVFAAQNNGIKEDKSAEAKKATGLLESVRALWKDENKKLSPDESVLVYLSRLYEQTAPEKSMQCLSQLEEIQLAEVPEELHPEGLEDEEQVKAALRVNLPPQLLNNIGCFLYQAEKVEQSRTMFQAALNACVRSQEKESELDTDALVTTISYNLGRSYEVSDMPEEAKKVYDGLLERHSDYTEANARLTYIALRQSPTDEGPKKMAKLYEADSSNLEVRALFGWYLSKSKKRTANLAEDQEQRHYKHTLQYFDKHDRYSLTGMGNVHLLTARDMRRETEPDKEKRRRMYERAVEFFDKALQLDPRNAYAAQGIAIALVDDKKDHSTAVHIFSRIRDTFRDAIGVASYAAAIAIQAGRGPAAALKLLEQGRYVMGASKEIIRAEVPGGLQGELPELMARFTALRDQVDQVVRDSFVEAGRGIHDEGRLTRLVDLDRVTPTTGSSKNDLHDSVTVQRRLRIRRPTADRSDAGRSSRTGRPRCRVGSRGSMSSAYVPAPAPAATLRVRQ